MCANQYAQLQLCAISKCATEKVRKYNVCNCIVRKTQCAHNQCALITCVQIQCAQSRTTRNFEYFQKYTIEATVTKNTPGKRKR